MAEVNAVDTTWNLCWIDLETTGLRPLHDEILEVGMILTEGPELRRVFEQSWVVNPQGPLTMHPHVLAMHAKSGLLQELSGGQFFESVAHEMLSVLKRFPGYEAPMLAGSSVEFDRGFLRVHAPEFEARLHYRNYDVRTLRTFYQGLVGHDILPDVVSTPAHRALPDLEVAITAASAIRCSVEAWRMKPDWAGLSVAHQFPPFTPPVPVYGPETFVLTTQDQLKLRPA